MIGEGLAERCEELGVVSARRKAPRFESVGPDGLGQVAAKVDSHLQEVTEGRKAGPLE